MKNVSYYVKFPNEASAQMVFLKGNQAPSGKVYPLVVEKDSTHNVESWYSSQNEITTDDGVVYVFDGWYLNDDFSGEKFTVGQTIAVDDNKSFYGHYVPKYCEVKVNKQVYGNMADPNKDYSFTAEVKVNGETFTPTVPDGSSYTIDSDSKIHFTLNGIEGQNSITLYNIPTNATVTITEAEYSGYTTTYYLGNNENTGNSVTLNVANSGREVTFKNSNTATVDTGITLDAMPYMLLLGGALAMLAVLLVRRRRES